MDRPPTPTDLQTTPDLTQGLEAVSWIRVRSRRRGEATCGCARQDPGQSERQRPSFDQGGEIRQTLVHDARRHALETPRLARAEIQRPRLFAAHEPRGCRASTAHRYGDAGLSLAVLKILE